MCVTMEEVSEIDKLKAIIISLHKKIKKLEMQMNNMNDLMSHVEYLQTTTLRENEEFKIYVMNKVKL